MQEKQLETSGKAWAESQLEPVNPIGLQRGAKPEKNNTAGFSSSGVFLGQGVGLFWPQQSLLLEAIIFYMVMNDLMKSMHCGLCMQLI